MVMKPRTSPADLASPGMRYRYTSSDGFAMTGTVLWESSTRKGLWAVSWDATAYNRTGMTNHAMNFDINSWDIEWL